MKIEINKGDTIFTGKWQNKREEVKTFGGDKNGQPLVNGKKVLKFRMEKFMKKDEEVSLKLKDILKEGQQKQFEKYADMTWRKLDLDEKIKALVAIKASGSGQILKKYNQGIK